MAGKIRKADLYKADRDLGMSYPEIARKYGVSHQAVAQACARRGIGHFKEYTPAEVVYPNLRRWLNDNKVARSEFARGIDRIPNGATSSDISNWFRGETYPQKRSIDKILAYTGLTYEVLFAQEGEDG